MIDGIDVSYWQGRIDWPAVAAAGKKFAIIRSGDGTFLDPLFEQNIQGALSAGLHVEIYHYLRLTTPAEDMAGLCRRRWAQAYELGMRGHLWLDLEDEYKGPWLPYERQVWLGRILDLTDSLPVGIYTGTWWWEPTMGIFPRAGQFPLWIGQYPFIDGCQTDPTQAGLSPVLPAAWDNWLIWQYTSKGRCPGIEGYVDLNVAQDSFLKEDDVDEARIRQIFKEEIGPYAKLLHWIALYLKEHREGNQNLAKQPLSQEEYERLLTGELP